MAKVQKTRLIHIAGIIPVADLTTDHGLETPGILTPVDVGYTTIQKSVYECAVAGCKTIWIIGKPDLAPIVRKMIGEWVYDPVYYRRTFTKFYSRVRTGMPIYYVPVGQKELNKDYPYGWSALYGAMVVEWVCEKLSKWVTPDKYFVSFPMAAYDLNVLRAERQNIATAKGNLFLTYKGMTVKDNLPLPFTLTKEEAIACQRDINQNSSKTGWLTENLEFAQVFNKVSENNALDLELEWYYNLSKWEEYKEYLGSENAMKKPYKGLTGPFKHAKIYAGKK